MHQLTNWGFILSNVAEIKIKLYTIYIYQKVEKLRSNSSLLNDNICLLLLKD